MTAAPPNSRQRGWMFTALGTPDLLMPEDIPARSLATMRRREWIQLQPGGDAPGPARHTLTATGRAALLTVPKCNALLSAETDGRISSSVAWPTLESLLREGLAVRLTAHGQPGTAADPAYISALGRRLVGLPAVDERPASQLLIEALAAHGIDAVVKRDEQGDTHVAVDRTPAYEAVFYRRLGPRGAGHSATHPAWMHASAWYGLVEIAGHGVSLFRDLDGADCAADSAEAAKALADLVLGPS
ncbi:hypothetical protein [Streptomyces sp. bgisy153]|uniref:hypothetical protein n=1 Tax=Streptomyces sp. bgisy153 TaxID=3413793 RepID=UPI003D745614